MNTISKYSLIATGGMDHVQKFAQPNFRQLTKVRYQVKPARCAG